MKLSINRGVVERFIAPVLKTGDPSRGPGVRIPPPLRSIGQSKSKPRKLYDFGAFVFRTYPSKTKVYDLFGASRCSSSGCPIPATADYGEQFKVMLLNRANKILGIFDVSNGSSTGTVADPKLIFAAAIKANACGIILAHNHPSGNLQPSQTDIDLTKSMNEWYRHP